ncbi:DUF4333 domain-containing protein [Litorihabitans aurantiacus]|uniref:DUF4333 domain-containing protein n=1 Tax=Litorihabitans aurantiacus TaxID=1930061 RepID=A0AA37XHF3_9MICO|nr:DUF4333 domain-containing protein [Litorihabitans aurantiacus]GMA32645.1 hypothetical protein GCM10025875_26370 [Litorihabitans aurantiacus]
MKRLALPVTTALGVLVLGACSFSASANRTVSADQVATEAEDALEEQIGQRPEISCGDDQVDLVDGEVVDCLLTDPSTGSEFDTTVTISDVDGTDFRIAVEVAEQPNA